MENHHTIYESTGCIENKRYSYISHKIIFSDYELATKNISVLCNLNIDLLILFSFPHIRTA